MPSQSIFLDSNQIAVTPGSPINFDLKYKVSDGEQTTGLANLNIYYNSDLLTPKATTADRKTINGFTPLRDTGGGIIDNPLGVTPAIVSDTTNIDGDANTDKYISLSYVSTSTKFPVTTTFASGKATAAEPTTLGKITFETSNNSALWDAAETLKINVNGEPATGYGFGGFSIQIDTILVFHQQVELLHRYLNPML